MKIKVLQYNIWNGGCQDNKPYITDWKRLDRVASIIREANADIVVLNECGYWPSATQLRVMDWKLFFRDMYGSPVASEQQFRWAPVVISKYPVVSYSSERAVYRHNTLDVTLNVNGRNFNLLVYHPHPEFSEAEKSAHLSKLLSSGVPDLLVGDLNALSPQDSYDEKQLTESFKRFMKDKAQKTIGDMLLCTTLKTALGAGLEDSLIASKKPWQFTVPTDLRDKRKDSAIRIDYILCKGFKVKDAGVIQNKTTNISSDHHPVYAILEA